jgi:penicillin amidase
LLHVRTPEWAAAGASFVGGPGIPAGHNGYAAWGVTAGLIDNTDLFREQIGPDGRSVRQGDRFVRCELRKEIIHIRGGDPVTETVLQTLRGPIVSPSIGEGTEALSLRALWLDPRPLRGLLCVHRALSFAEFRDLCAFWPAASQNMVYADASGAVGWQMLGQAPLRRKGWGTLPLPGWDPEAGWEPGTLPHEQLPHAVDPPCGFVATANNQPVPEGLSPFLGADWIDGYRIAAIDRALSARSDWDVASTMALQTDQRTLTWDDLRPAVLAAPVSSPASKRALEMLRDWDGNMAEESPAAAVFELFVAELAGRVARAKAPRSFEYMLGKGLSPLMAYNFFCFRRTAHLARLLRTQPEGWFPRPWPDEVADVLTAVVQRLRLQHGDNERRWAWGRLRPLVRHHPLGRKRWLGRLFNRGPVPCGGNTDTINQASVLPLAPLAPADNIASLRMVVDVGAWDDSRFVLPGGQSGNPLSPHYDDQFPLWRRGEGVPIAWSPEAVRKASRETLELVPADEES